MQIVSSSSSPSAKVDIWMISSGLGALSALLALMGLRSVVLANFFQYLIMVACNLLIIFLGIKHFGDFAPIPAGNSTTSSSGFMKNFERLWNVTKETGRGGFFEFHENFRYVTYQIDFLFKNLDEYFSN